MTSRQKITVFQLTYCQNECSIEKSAMLITRSGKKTKKQMREGIELPNKERIRTFGEKETYKYLGILEAVAFKQVEMCQNECSIEKSAMLITRSGKKNKWGKE